MSWIKNIRFYALCSCFLLIVCMICLSVFTHNLSILFDLLFRWSQRQQLMVPYAHEIGIWNHSSQCQIQMWSITSMLFRVYLFFFYAYTSFCFLSVNFRSFWFSLIFFYQFSVSYPNFFCWSVYTYKNMMLYNFRCYPIWR